MKKRECKVVLVYFHKENMVSPLQFNHCLNVNFLSGGNHRIRLQSLVAKLEIPLQTGAEMLEAKTTIESKDSSSFVSSVIVPSGLPLSPGTFVVASLATFRDLSTP